MEWKDIDAETQKFMDKRREAFIAELAPKALPGNFYWRRVEALQGFEGDWRPEDIDGGDEDPRGMRRED